MAGAGGVLSRRRYALTYARQPRHLDSSINKINRTQATAANDGAALRHAAATRLLVALFRADRNRVASRVAKLSLNEKQARARAGRGARLQGCCICIRKEETASRPSNMVSEETESRTRHIKAAVAALARGSEMPPTPDVYWQTRADIARIARKDLLSGMLERQVRRRGPLARGAGLRRRFCSAASTAICNGRRLGR